MRRCLCVFLCCWGSLLGAQPSDSLAQKGWVGRTLEQMFGEARAPGKPHYLIYPTLGYAPETSLEVGLSAVALFYAKGDYQHNRLSEIQLFSFITFRKQYGIWFDHAVYGDQDKWFLLGRIRQQRFPLLYFGIGPETSGDEPNLIQANYTLVRERVLRKLRPNLFLGLEFDFQRLYQAEFERAPVPEPLGVGGSANVGLGIGLVYDNRKNVLNERQGLFAELAYLEYQPAWGSRYAFRGLLGDLRYFVPMQADQQQVLAFQAVGAFMSGEVPFNQLGLLGGEQIMRGYYLGRLRDRHYLAAQVEYRFLPFPFSKRFGGAAFIGLGGVAPRIGDLRLSQFRPAGGFGLRFLLFPQKDIYVRLDLGITQEGTGIYFFTGEAF